MPVPPSMSRRPSSYRVTVGLFRAAGIAEAAAAPCPTPYASAEAVATRKLISPPKSINRSSGSRTDSLSAWSPRCRRQRSDVQHALTHDAWTSPHPSIGQAAPALDTPSPASPPALRSQAVRSFPLRRSSDRTAAVGARPTPCKYLGRAERSCAKHPPTDRACACRGAELAAALGHGRHCAA